MVGLTPLHLLAGCATGVLSAYFAYRRGKNPYFWFFIGWAFGMLGVVALFFADRRPQRSSKATASPKSTPPKKVLRGPTDKFWYYAEEKGDGSKGQEGPVSRDTIERLWREGQLHEGSLVWHEELKEWTKLGQCIAVERKKGTQPA